MSTRSENKNIVTFLDALISYNMKRFDHVNELLNPMPIAQLFEAGTQILVLIARCDVEKEEIQARIHFAACRMQDLRLQSNQLEQDGSFPDQVESHLRLSDSLLATDFTGRKFNATMSAVSRSTLAESLFLAVNLLAQDFGSASDVNMLYAEITEDIAKQVTDGS